MCEKMKQIKVCHLTSVHTPFDTRIFHKEAKTLARGKYKVVLIAQHTIKEEVDGITIVPLPVPKNKFDRIFRTTWLLLLRALKEQAHIYHFHDPELLPVGVILKLFTRAKVIYDVHEDYSEKIADKEWLGNTAFAKTSAFLVSLFERLAGVMFDRIVAVIEDISIRFPENKTIVIKNYVSLEMIDKVKPYEKRNDRVIVIYAGRLSRKRGISEIITAMEYVEEQAELWLLGKWDTPEFEKECMSLKGWEHTKYLGKRNLEDVYSFYKIADIGLHCVYKNDYYMKGLPTKVFEYAACRLPVIMTYCEDWEEMFGDFAVFADTFDPRDIAKKISLLSHDKKLRESLGEKARKLIEKAFNWEIEEGKLLGLYKDILKDEV